MQTILRMVGFGDNAGSGFPMILLVWKDNGWIELKLVEDTKLNQVILYLKMEKDQDENVMKNFIENVMDISEKNLKELLPGYSKKKLAKAVTILKMISDNQNIN